MKRVLAMLLVAAVCVSGIAPVFAAQITAPQPEGKAGGRVPERGVSFGQGLWKILGDLLPVLQPELYRGIQTGFLILAAALLTGLTQILAGKPLWAATLAGVCVIGVVILKSSRSCITLGSDTVTELSEYEKLLLPVMTAALSAQGGMTSATALYAGTTAFCAFVTAMLRRFMIPSVYFFLALATVSAATGETLLKRCKDVWKSLCTWLLRSILTVFTVYMGITGAVTGTTDKTALKATKSAISAAVPVVGGILSDASEAVLLSAAWVKNAAGVYGILAVLAIFLEPFARIGIQYLVLKLTACACELVEGSTLSGYVEDCSYAMGMLLGMVGSICLIMLISCICFMQGVSG